MAMLVLYDTLPEAAIVSLKEENNQNTDIVDNQFHS